jgi:uncharacterized alkaline shock family protein YloU
VTPPEGQSASLDYRIATSALEAMVKGCLLSTDRIRLSHVSALARGHGIEVTVIANSCRVTLSLEARFGEDLNAVAAEVQGEVGRCLGTMTGLDVEAIDIVFTGVYPIADAE